MKYNRITNTMRLLTIYILAKNEEVNIAKCLRSLAPYGTRTVVLDSGSSDGTLDVVREFSFCIIESYNFRGHAAAYNEITGIRTKPSDFAMVLDADMEVRPELFSEVKEFICEGQADVLKAPVLMFVEGQPLRFGSLYPPKPFVFKGGKEYFTAAGHSDRLLPDVSCVTARNFLIHNDLKPYEQYLLSQVRYGNNLWQNYLKGAVNFKDKLRVRTIVSGFIMAGYSFFLKGGFLAGQTGLAYALDRLIAGLVQYRVCLGHKIRRSSFRDSSTDSLQGAGL